MAKKLSNMNDLWASLTQRTPITHNGITGIVSNIQAEDGSGRKFNVTIGSGNDRKTFFVQWK